MFWKLPCVTISSLQRTTKPMFENEIVCVFKQSDPAFYTVSPDRFKQLIEAEEVLKDLQKQMPF